jgi:hypothetical protein
MEVIRDGSITMHKLTLIVSPYFHVIALVYILNFKLASYTKAIKRCKQIIIVIQNQFPFFH